ncbi:MAG TPA: Smr/MutS family protein [Candidatus Saccharimonadia bacterium]|nr:Smr/MutS family protein [Candidatus Saccharimonadia bacterium]
MPKKREVTSEEAALFRAAIGEVVPLEDDHAELRPAPPPPVPRQSRADERDVMREAMAADPSLVDGAEELAYVQAGASRRILRKLGGGDYSVLDTIDLHDMPATLAAASIATFLDENRRADRLCVRIVHGKGLRSGPEGPVLKRLTDRLLRQRGDVLAFRSARPADGGAGAVIVLLKPRKP